MATDTELQAAAEQVFQRIRIIGRLLRQTVEAEIARGGLTMPQADALDVLAQQSDGLSLKELSQRMGLAHSTVSGIVDRLEKQGLVERQPDPQDRRFTRIVPTEPVRRYVAQSLPQRLHAPVAEALASATPDEREQIVVGLATLERLLQARLGGASAGSAGGLDPNGTAR